MAGDLSQITLNYLFIQFSILLFIAPFYLAYKFKNNSKFKSLALNKHIEEFLSSQQTNYLVLTWAAAEAMFWFIIPEFLLLLVIFLKVQNKRNLLIYDILGTAVGTALGFILATQFNVDVTKVAYIAPNMVSQVGAWYSELGTLALFFQPFSGVPYKVFVLTAPQFGLNFLGFVFLGVVIRVARYYIFYLLFVGLYPFLHRGISRHYLPIFMLSCFLFSALLLKVYHSYGDGYVVDVAGAAKIRSLVGW